MARGAPRARRCSSWARAATATTGRTRAGCWPRASLLVQRFAGVAAEPLIAEPGREGLLDAAAGAGLLVIGLSDRWREEGLGATRSEIAARRAGADPLRPPRHCAPGALAPRDDVTRFTWSSPVARRRRRVG